MELRVRGRGSSGCGAIRGFFQGKFAPTEAEFHDSVMPLPADTTEIVHA
jgi:hypothetical protein